MPTTPPATLLNETATSLPFTTADDGAITLQFQAKAGLYQFSVIADATRFDWEELYVTLNQFHNTNQRTGPWDFSLLNQNAPLIPSYWVEVDDRRIGLWFFQRVSLEDIQARRFRGTMAFHVPGSGHHGLRLVPYRPMAIQWLSATLEDDPDDHLEPVRWNTNDWERDCPARAWASPGFWHDLATGLTGTHARYQAPLRRVFDWIRNKHTTPQPQGVGSLMDYLRRPWHPEDVLPLLMLHHLENDPHALPAALRAVDEAINLPHWGNPKVDGYSHDGDMGAAAMLRALSWAWHALSNHLGDERRERLRAKLVLQGNRFFDLALLNRDYWGGSVIQDHGHKALYGFGTAALNLLGVLPDAERWVSYALPRLRRSMQALPRDGVVPQSSYFQLSAYMDEPTFYRDTLNAFSGEDIFDQPLFHSIVDYLLGVLREQDRTMIVAPAGTLLFFGGNLFLNRMASKFGDHRAAYLEEVALHAVQAQFSHGVLEHGYHHGILWGLLSYDPAVKPVPPAAAALPLRHFEDSALAHYRDPQADVTLSVHSGPISGYHAYRHARGPCDRMEMLMGPGHFIVARGSRTILVTPDGGYRLKTASRSCLLVDGQGPIGDIGYPMSIPSFRHPGDEIVSTRWNPDSKCGQVRLDLTPAWPESLGMARYTREFVMVQGREILCRDQVVFSQPHLLEWRFQTLKSLDIMPDGPMAFQIGGSHGIRLEAKPVGVALEGGIAPTEVVYSYSSNSGFADFQHVRFSSREPVTAATVAFVITWPE